MTPSASNSLKDTVFSRLLVVMVCAVGMDMRRLRGQVMVMRVVGDMLHARVCGHACGRVYVHAHACVHGHASACAEALPHLRRSADNNTQPTPAMTETRKYTQPRSEALWDHIA